jgi:hypothetical protein
LLQGDADIFFPTDFWLLERIDHYCSGWLKLQDDNSSKKGKKRRTITVSAVVLFFIALLSNLCSQHKASSK